jgi:hypothetical protein
MGQRRHHQGKQQRRRPAAPQPSYAPLTAVPEKKTSVAFGKPVLLLEDGEKNVFVYSAGQWVAYNRTIAECRVDCQVKQLPQTIKGMTRYEVCVPLE